VFLLGEDAVTSVMETMNSGMVIVGVKPISQPAPLTFAKAT